MKKLTFLVAITLFGSSSYAGVPSLSLSYGLDCTQISSRTNDVESSQLYIDPFGESAVLYLNAADFAAGTNGIRSNSTSEYTWTKDGVTTSITLEPLKDKELNQIATKITTATSADDVGSTNVSVGVCILRQ